MSTLHVLSQSPFTDGRLTSCLRLLGPADGLLLCADAVYGLTSATLPFQALQSSQAELFALEEDIQARNITAPDWIKMVDYPGFVALTVRFDKVNTWL